MKENRFTLWLLSFIILLAIIGVFARIMTSLSHNEHMYIVAGIFVADNQVLYKDFGFVQTPYLPLLYGALFKWFNVKAYYLLLGKFISFFSVCLSALTLLLLTRRISREITHCLSVVALFLLNITIVDSAAEVSNYILPLTLSLVSFYIFSISLTKNPSNWFGMMVSGFLLAIATGLKLTYASVIIPYLTISVVDPLISINSTRTVKKNIVYVFLPLVAGFIVGLLPVLFLLSDVEAFVFNNLGYHTLNTQWRRITEYTGTMSLTSKINYARLIFFQADNLLLLFTIILGPLLSVNNRQMMQRIKGMRSTSAVLAFLLVLTAVATAIAPTPSFYQYFATPISFLFLLLIYSFSAISSDRPALYGRFLFMLVLFSAAYSVPLRLRQAVDLTQRNGWSGLRVHDTAMEIEAVLTENGMRNGRKIATLSPLFVIDSTFSTYSELSTGPFLYRIGDLISAEQRNHFVVSSPNTINDLLHSDPPAAILVGFEKELDDPLIAYALNNNYKKVTIAGFNGDFYVQP